jgi:hypothetical protein
MLTVAFLFALGTQAAAGEPDPAGAAIYDAAARATAKGWTDKTKMLGFSIVKTAFTEVPREGAVLVGFDLGIGKFLDIENIYALRAVYRTADGEVSSFGEHGLFKDKRGLGKKVVKTKVTHTVRLRARPGYAVGSLTLRSGLNINGLSVTFMRINGTALDPRQSYESEWVADRTGGSESTVTSNGAPIVGVFGNEGPDHVMALGLIYMQRPGEPAPAAEPRPPQPAPKPAARTPRQAPEPPQDAANPPLAQKPPALPNPIKGHFLDKYFDHENHFSMTIPDGWHRMFRSELNEIAKVLRQRRLDSIVQYQSGFRPDSSAPRTLPYVLIQVHPLKTAGLTYEEIQETLDLGFDESIKFVEGRFSDVLSDLSVGKAVVDRTRHRFVVHLQSEVFGVGKVDGLGTCHLGAEAVVMVNCYGNSETFARLLPTFTDLNNSFFFDDGYEFVPAKPRETGASSWAPYLMFGGVAIALCVGLLGFLGWHLYARGPVTSPTRPARRPPTAIPVQSTGIREAPLPAPLAWPPALDTNPPSEKSAIQADADR